MAFAVFWDPLVGAMERSRAIALVARILSILIDWTWDWHEFSSIALSPDAIRPVTKPPLCQHKLRSFYRTI